MDVLDAQRDVVDPGSAFRDVFRNRRIRSCAFEQFDGGATERNKVRPDVLRDDLLRSVHMKPQRVSIEGERLFKVRDGDADVIEGRTHGSGPVGRASGGECPVEQLRHRRIWIEPAFGHRGHDAIEFAGREHALDPLHEAM